MRCQNEVFGFVCLLACLILWCPLVAPLKPKDTVNLGPVIWHDKRKFKGRARNLALEGEAG